VRFAWIIRHVLVSSLTILTPNHLTNIFTTELHGLSSLDELILSDNAFQGKINEMLGKKLTSLEFLHISENQISGSIPAIIGDFVKLKEISIKKNHITGTVSSELGRLTELQILFM